VTAHAPVAGRGRKARAAAATNPWSVQGQVEHAAAAQRVCWRVAERLGEALSADPRGHRLAGALIMDSIAHIFAEGLMGHFADRPNFDEAGAMIALTAPD